MRSPYRVVIVSFLYALVNIQVETYCEYFEACSQSMKHRLMKDSMLQTVTWEKIITTITIVSRVTAGSSKGY